MKLKLWRSKFARKHSGFSLGSLFLALTVCASSITGCTAGSTPTPEVYPTAIGSCFPASVFTAEQMRARVDCHPSDYKLEIDENNVVLFAFPDSLRDWVGPIFVIHVPSVSEAVLSRDGNILFESYKSSEGRAVIERVLNSSELMSRILEQARQ
jgi:hypothetical protein